MLSTRTTQRTIRMLDWLAKHTLPEPQGASHQQTGRRGEEDAYFYLRKLGYVMVAQNFRTPLHRGEIDLIGWDRGKNKKNDKNDKNEDVLCFIEVKTRTTRDVKPAEAAVDRDKQRALVRVAKTYMRHMGGDATIHVSGAEKKRTDNSFPPFRFDVISVYYDQPCGAPQFELFRNAFPVA